jgi:tyrosyl-tRNA synthetase
MSSTTLSTAQLLDELSWRGLLNQYTEGLNEWLARGPVTVYCGFDPSAPSLHVGNLIPVMGLAHLQRAGHRPIVLVGGGTGMIGDPSGKTVERQLNSPDVVAANTRGIRSQLERFLDFSGTRGALMRDNAEWLMPLGAVDFLRDVGKHFTVNYMLQKESVKTRMEAGITYTEFSYMLLQSYDYLELHRREGATLQIGGSDQWGNITAGVELIRRADGHEAHALTLPLVTTASGTKFGKTESGAVWLDPERSSPYRMYQFWINTDDRDVGRYLRFFTLLGREEIEALEREAAEHPERRAAQQALANDVTARVHGADAARTATEVSALLFGKGEASELSAGALRALAAEVPFVELEGGAAEGEGGSLDVLELFVATKLAASKGAARRLLEQGGLNVNGKRLGASDRTIAREELLPGGHLLLRKGAREYALVRVEG